MCDLAELSFCVTSQLQALQGCESPGKSVLKESSSHGMRGEPGVHPEMYSRSSSVASPVNIDSSCGSEYSTPLASPDDQQHRSVASGHHRQQNRVPHRHAVNVDTDTGLSSALSCLCIQLSTCHLPLSKMYQIWFGGTFADVITQLCHILVQLFRVFDFVEHFS